MHSWPPAPWMLRGEALHTIQTIPIRAAAATVPGALQIVPVLPGRTLGGIYAARYGPGSTLEYSELVVASAVVWGFGRPGIWISHIYVDSQESLRGGREIWGLPKELAEFTWTTDSVTVRQGDLPLCSARFHRPSRGMGIWAPIPAFGRPAEANRWFVARAQSRVGLLTVDWETPLLSPFESLIGGGRRLAVFHSSMTAQIPGPSRPVGPL